MSVQLPTHNELISSFSANIGEGNLAEHEVAGIFSGRFNQPIQFALRHLKTLRIVLVDVHRDGSIHLPERPPGLAFAA